MTDLSPTKYDLYIFLIDYLQVNQVSKFFFFYEIHFFLLTLPNITWKNVANMQFKNDNLFLFI